MCVSVSMNMESTMFILLTGIERLVQVNYFSSLGYHPYFTPRRPAFGTCVSGGAASANRCMAFASRYSLRTAQSSCSLSECEEWAYAGGTDVCGEVASCFTSMWVGKLEYGGCYGCGRFFFSYSTSCSCLFGLLESRYCTRIFFVHGQGKRYSSIFYRDFS